MYMQKELHSSLNIGWYLQIAKKASKVSTFLLSLLFYHDSISNLKDSSAENII